MRGVCHHFGAIGVTGGWLRTHRILGGYPMSDKSRNLVHLRWLLKLIYFRVAGELSWGSAMLSTLYRDMCRVT
ncbi:hypothetical protein Goari_019516 [Gossypium aridum]|uniref:Uncharacterized protein n=1 Tax=Gossypium aridum TaxID=34290 RepID=A0A7J8WT31_GOSAI|nr:hypothetical protein [Gossypium aridum]